MKQLFIPLLAGLLLSCNSGADKERLAASEKKEGQNNMDTTRTVFEFENTPQKTKATYEDWDRKIIKNAEVNLELKDYTSYNQALHRDLKKYGAYIATETQGLSEGRSANNLTIKVPVEQFENLMNSFTGEGITVLYKKISSEDVTGEVVDTKARMQAKKQTRDRYLDLLKQAKNMKEILEVQQEINATQEEIESASGRVNYLTHQSLYSTIHLNYFQYANPNDLTNNQPGYLVKLKESFNLGIGIIANLFIFMVTIWPLILISLVAVWLWKKQKTKILSPLPAKKE